MSGPSCPSFAFGMEVWFFTECNQIIVPKLAGTWGKQLFSVMFPPWAHKNILEMAVV